jgi:ligand-binding sensor domain-containing protein
VDQQGVLWIGINEAGLVRFDGVNWTLYNTETSALTNDDVYCIAVDGDNNKWIGSYGTAWRHSMV